MANLKDIRRRIGSVKNTQKITSAMKMVAAARLRKAQVAAESFRDYADMMSAILAEVAFGVDEGVHPLLQRREAKKSMVLTMASDRGLCGGFNSNLNRMVDEHITSSEPKPSLSIIGKKASAFFKRRDVSIGKTYDDIYEETGYSAAARVARELINAYETKETDSIELAYNKMISVVSQKPSIRQLLPVKLPEKEEREDAKLGPVGFIYEPDREELLGRLLPKYVEVEVYRALLESIAAEQAARMTAMDTATTNAEEMIEHLTLIYNRARQSAITSELMDIVGGAEALD